MKLIIATVLLAVLFVSCTPIEEGDPSLSDMTGIYQGTASGTVDRVPVSLALLIDLDETTDLGLVAGLWSAGPYSGHLSGDAYGGDLTNLFVVMTNPCWASSAFVDWRVESNRLTGRYDALSVCVGGIALYFDATRE